MTGSGKTAAFVLPILHHLISKPRGKTRALVVTPTRELAAQILTALDLRPTTAVRSSLQFSRLTIARKSDGSRFSSETIPRIKVEYQISPPLFLRLVGQYAARSRSALRDRNGNPILVNGVLDAGETTNEFSTDWLFSYRPVPGTLVYLGYGSTLEEPREFRFQDLRRTRDGFFGKISYLFRL